jgi:hypothetical protein
VEKNSAEDGFGSNKTIRKTLWIRKKIKASLGLLREGHYWTMTEHNFFYPYASFTSAQLTLLTVAALYFDKLCLLNPVGASWATVGVDHHTREAK